MSSHSALHCTDWGYETSSRKWNRGHNGLHQLGQPVAPSILFPGRRFISPVCTRVGGCNILNIDLARRELPEFCFLWPFRRGSLLGRTGEKILPYLMEKGNGPSVSQSHVAAALRALQGQVGSHDSGGPSKLGMQSGDFTQPSSDIREDRDVKCETCHSADGPGSGTMTEIGLGPDQVEERGRGRQLWRRSGATDFEIWRAFSKSHQTKIL